MLAQLCLILPRFFVSVKRSLEIFCAEGDVLAFGLLKYVDASKFCLCLSVLSLQIRKPKASVLSRWSTTNARTSVASKKKARRTRHAATRSRHPLRHKAVFGIGPAVKPQGDIVSCRR